MVKENIKLLKKFDRKHKNKDINNHKVKFSLTTKVIILNVGLTIVLIALIAKEGLKMLFSFTDLRLSLMYDGLRYFVLVFLLLGICPLIIKKMKM